MNTSFALQLFVTSLRGVRSPATVEWYARRLAPLVDALGQRPIAELTVDELRTWRAELSSRKVSGWTFHAYVRSAKRLFAWLVKEGHLSSSPAARLELPRTPRDPPPAISEADMQTIIQGARGIAREYALCLFLADTGCRLGGVAGLKIEDLDLTTGRALVKEKGSKTRQVYFTRRTGRALRTYIGARRTGPVWLGIKSGHVGEPLKACGIYQAIKRLAKASKVVGRCNPHSWRHRAARGWLKRKASLGVVSQLLGHSGVAVTARFYGSFTDDELRAAHRQCTIVSEDED